MSNESDHYVDRKILYSIAIPSYFIGIGFDIHTYLILHEDDKEKYRIKRYRRFISYSAHLYLGPLNIQIDLTL